MPWFVGLLVTLLASSLGQSASAEPENKTEVCGPAPQKHIVCYYQTENNEFQIEDLNPCLCTHLVYGSIGLDSDMLFTDQNEENFKSMKSLKLKNPDLKTIISIKDTSVLGSTPLRNFASNSTTTDQLGKKLRKLVRETNTNGIDIEWVYEYSNNTNTTTEKLVLTNFFKRLRTALDDVTLTLTTSKNPSALINGYDFKNISKYVDFINIPAFQFDLCNKSIAQHHGRLHGVADMENMDSMVDLLLTMGTNKEKIVIGIPTFGISYKLTNESETKPGSPVEYGKPMIMTHSEICVARQSGNWTLVREKDQTAPYVYKGKTWIGFDDEISFKLKSKYILLRNLGGVMVFTANQDDYRGMCGNGRFPLLRSIRDVLSNSKSKTGVNGTDELEEYLDYSESRVVEVTDQLGNLFKTDYASTDTVEGMSCTRQGYYRHPADCTRFYRCVKFNQLTDAFSIFQYDCPSGLVFDERHEVCNWPSWSPPCDGSGEILPRSRNDFYCPDLGYYRDPENCRIFFYCNDVFGNGTLSAYEFKCPYNLAFDEERLVCDWPLLVSGCAEKVGVIGVQNGFASGVIQHGGLFGGSGLVHTMRDNQARRGFRIKPLNGYQGYASYDTQPGLIGGTELYGEARISQPTPEGSRATLQLNRAVLGHAENQGLVYDDGNAGGYALYGQARHQQGSQGHNQGQLVGVVDQGQFVGGVGHRHGDQGQLIGTVGQGHGEQGQVIGVIQQGQGVHGQGRLIESGYDVRQEYQGGSVGLVGGSHQQGGLIGLQEPRGYLIDQGHQEGKSIGGQGQGSFIGLQEQRGYVIGQGHQEGKSNGGQGSLIGLQEQRGYVTGQGHQEGESNGGQGQGSLIGLQEQRGYVTGQGHQEGKSIGGHGQGSLIGLQEQRGYVTGQGHQEGKSIGGHGQGSLIGLQEQREYGIGQVQQGGSIGLIDGRQGQSGGSLIRLQEERGYAVGQGHQEGKSIGLVNGGQGQGILNGGYSIGQGQQGGSIELINGGQGQPGGSFIGLQKQTGYAISQDHSGQGQVSSLIDLQQGQQGGLSGQGQAYGIGLSGGLITGQNLPRNLGEIRGISQGQSNLVIENQFQQGRSNYGPARTGGPRGDEGVLLSTGGQVPPPPISPIGGLRPLGRPGTSYSHFIKLVPQTKGIPEPPLATGVLANRLQNAVAALQANARGAARPLNPATLPVPELGVIGGTALYGQGRIRLNPKIVQEKVEQVQFDDKPIRGHDTPLEQGLELEQEVKSIHKEQVHFQQPIQIQQEVKSINKQPQLELQVQPPKSTVYQTAYHQQPVGVKSVHLQEQQPTYVQEQPQVVQEVRPVVVQQQPQVVVHQQPQVVQEIRPVGIKSTAYQKTYIQEQPRLIVNQQEQPQVVVHQQQPQVVVHQQKPKIVVHQQQPQVLQEVRPVGVKSTAYQTTYVQEQPKVIQEFRPIQQVVVQQPKIVEQQPRPVAVKSTSYQTYIQEQPKVEQQIRPVQQVVIQQPQPQLVQQIRPVQQVFQQPQVVQQIRPLQQVVVQQPQVVVQQPQVVQQIRPVGVKSTSYQTVHLSQPKSVEQVQPQIDLFQPYVPSMALDVGLRQEYYMRQQAHPTYGRLNFGEPAFPRAPIQPIRTQPRPVLQPVIEPRPPKGDEGLPKPRVSINFRELPIAVKSIHSLPQPSPFPPNIAPNTYYSSVHSTINLPGPRQPGRTNYGEARQPIVERPKSVQYISGGQIEQQSYGIKIPNQPITPVTEVKTIHQEPIRIKSIHKEPISQVYEQREYNVVQPQVVVEQPRIPQKTVELQPITIPIRAQPRPPPPPPKSIQIEQEITPISVQYEPVRQIVEQPRPVQYVEQPRPKVYTEVKSVQQQVQIPQPRPVLVPVAQPVQKQIVQVQRRPEPVEVRIPVQKIPLPPPPPPKSIVQVHIEKPPRQQVFVQRQPQPVVAVKTIQRPVQPVRLDLPPPPRQQIIVQKQPQAINVQPVQQVYKQEIQFQELPPPPQVEVYQPVRIRPAPVKPVIQQVQVPVEVKSIHQARPLPPQPIEVAVAVQPLPPPPPPVKIVQPVVEVRQPERPKSVQIIQEPIRFQELPPPPPRPIKIQEPQRIRPVVQPVIELRQPERPKSVQIIQEPIRIQEIPRPPPLPKQIIVQPQPRPKSVQIIQEPIRIQDIPPPPPPPKQIKVVQPQPRPKTIQVIEEPIRIRELPPPPIKIARPEPRPVQIIQEPIRIQNPQPVIEIAQVREPAPPPKTKVVDFQRLPKTKAPIIEIQKPVIVEQVKTVQIDPPVTPPPSGRINFAPARERRPRPTPPAPLTAGPQEPRQRLRERPQSTSYIFRQPPSGPKSAYTQAPPEAPIPAPGEFDNIPAPLPNIDGDNRARPASGSLLFGEARRRKPSNDENGSGPMKIVVKYGQRLQAEPSSSTTSDGKKIVRVQVPRGSLNQGQESLKANPDVVVKSIKTVPIQVPVATVVTKTIPDGRGRITEAGQVKTAQRNRKRLRNRPRADPELIKSQLLPAEHRFEDDLDFRQERQRVNLDGVKSVDANGKSIQRENLGVKSIDQSQYGAKSIDQSGGRKSIDADGKSIQRENLEVKSIDQSQYGVNSRSRESIDAGRKSIQRENLGTKSIDQTGGFKSIDTEGKSTQRETIGYKSIDESDYGKRGLSAGLKSIDTEGKSIQRETIGYKSIDQSDYGQRGSNADQKSIDAQGKSIQQETLRVTNTDETEYGSKSIQRDSSKVGLKSIDQGNGGGNLEQSRNDDLDSDVAKSSQRGTKTGQRNRSSRRRQELRQSQKLRQPIDRRRLFDNSGNNEQIQQNKDSEVKSIDQDQGVAETVKPKSNKRSRSRKGGKDALPDTACTRPGLFRHPDNCNKFYECFYDKWLNKFTLHMFECPIRLAFDEGVFGCTELAAKTPCKAKRSTKSTTTDTKDN